VNLCTAAVFGCDASYSYFATPSPAISSKAPSPSISSKVPLSIPAMGVTLEHATKAPIAQTTIESITAQIDNQLSSPPESLSSRLRFENISPENFAGLLETPLYKKLYSNDSHVRFNYNSLTRTLIIQYMTTPTHNAAQSFIAETIFRNPAFQNLEGLLTIASGTDFLGFRGRYKFSQKQPDVLVCVNREYWPSLVVESGWSEDYNDLVEDAKLWLLGGQGGPNVGTLDLQDPVNVVILIYFDHKKFDLDTSKPITGIFEVWRRDPAKSNAIKKFAAKVSVLNPSLSQ
jgi:hypothetical protein